MLDLSKLSKYSLVLGPNNLFLDLILDYTLSLSSPPFISLDLYTLMLLLINLAG